MTLVTVLGVAACADGPSTATKPGAGGHHARVGFTPVFSAAARAAAARLVDFGITFDHVRVVIVRPVADTVKDTTIAFVPGQADVTLDLTVEVLADGETFRAGIDFTNPSGVVFHGEGTVQSHAPDQPAPVQQITVNYTGPGATVTRIVVAPKTSSVVAPATVTFTATAFDANNAVVPGTPFSWTTSDQSLATISNTGTLTPAGKRGAVTVTAAAPTKATDNASLTISLLPSALVLVSGGGQSGKAGTALAQPAVVRATASDGVGVAGVSVNFAAPPGGKVGAASVTTDANGIASTALTLGGAIGPQSFAAAALGFSVSVPAIATAGDASAVAVVSGGGQSDTVKHALKLPLVVKVTDSFGNPIGNVTVSWQRTAGTGTVSAATSVTGADGMASIGYTLGAAAGTETITASVSGGATPATFTETALSGPASAIAIVSGNGQAARILQALAPFVVKVTDDGGNPVNGATVAWTATNGTLSATTTSDATGQSSNTMTLGTVAGGATATASVAGKSVTFSTTVQTGTVSRIVFQTGPPATAAAGASVSPSIQVALQDAAGNLTAATNAVTIALGANPTGGTLSGTLTRNAVAGIATFDDLKLNKTGAGYTLVASSAGVPNVTSAAFTIGAGAPGSLVIVAGDGQTGTVNTVVALTPSVRLLDLSGNVIPGAPVTFTPAQGSGSVVPATAISTDQLGVATLASWTFGVLAGPQSLVVSSPGVTSVTIRATTIPGPAARLAIATQPSAAQSGIAFATQPAIQVQDANGNAILQSGITISAAIATGGGTLGGTLSAVTDAAGRATFTNLTLNGVVGPRTLSFTSTGLTSATSNSIALAAGAAAELLFSVNPTNVASGGAITPTIAVTLLDAAGNTVTTATNAVALTITPGTGTQGAVLSGNATVNAVNGVASYPGLSVILGGAGYTLTATSPGLKSTVSAAFNVTGPTVNAVAPDTVDAVFTTLPVTLTGANFIIGGTTVSVTGGNITPANMLVRDAATLVGNFDITGGAATSTPTVTVTTAQGVSNAFPFALYSVGGAPVQLGAPNGGGGGNAYSLDCPAGSVATGLNAAGGTNVDRIQVICQTVTGAGRTFGAPTFTTTAGGTGGSPATLSCPANYVLTGLTGFIGNGGSGLNDEIAGLCTSIDRSGISTTGTVGAVNQGAVQYSASCPIGLVVTGIQGGAGNLLDRTQIKCR